jgi:glycosyltransferase involved in cell wall biosynthesis
MTPVEQGNMDRTILINAQHLSVEASGGAGKYAYELIDGLLRCVGTESHEGLRIVPINLASGGNHDSARRPDWKFRIRNRIPSPLLPFARGVYRWMKGTRGGGVTGLALSHEADPDVGEAAIFHELTNYTGDSRLGRVALQTHTKLCVTFLDVQDLFYPQYFDDQTLSARRLYYSFYKDRADLIFAISQFTKDTLVERLGIEPERIVVTHLAADELDPEALGEDIVAWARSHGRYLVYPSKLWAHKNHANLIKAMGRVAPLFREKRVKLLFTGGFSPSDRKYLVDLAETCRAVDLIDIVGFLPKAKLQALIRHAEMMVFPSLFEGFGMPVLEAMQLGCPVVASRAGSLHEICGDAMLPILPEDADDIAGVLEAVCEGRVDREALIARGYEQAKKFDWRNTVMGTLNGYLRLLG